jgi:hypothetical protein
VKQGVCFAGREEHKDAVEALVDGQMDLGWLG